MWSVPRRRRLASTERFERDADLVERREDVEVRDHPAGRAVELEDDIRNPEVSERASDQPALNRRTAALVGQVVVLERAIVDGRGRVQIADAYWDVTGPELPAGTRVRIVGGDAMDLQVEPA